MSKKMTTTKMKDCKHLEIKYCEECVYYICKKCKAVTNTRNPLKFWGGGKTK